MRALLIGLTLALLALYPLSWVAPLARAGLLPLFGLSEISVLSGIVTLWPDTPLLAVVVALFAVLAPMAKLLALLALLLGRLGRRWMRPVALLGRLAMADVFLIAIYVTLAKGVGLGHVETGWGLGLFTFCTLASLALSWAVETRLDRK